MCINSAKVFATLTSSTRRGTLAFSKHSCTARVNALHLINSHITEMNGHYAVLAAQYGTGLFITRPGELVRAMDSWFVFRAGTSAILTEGFRRLPQSLPGIVLRLGHDSLLPFTLQFIIQQNPYHGRPRAQAVSRRLPTTTAWVRVRVMSRRICGQSTSVSSANSNSTDCSTIIIIYHLGLV
jgi:hypothetical protein